MLALDFLCIPFAWTMRFGVQMTLIRPPMIRIKTGEPEGLKQRFQLQKNLVFAAAKNIRQDSSSAMINGMTEPSWLLFLAHKTPHLIHIGFDSDLNIIIHDFVLTDTQAGPVDA